MGRAGDVMNYGGVKIGPFPIELALLDGPGVVDAAVVAVSQDNGFDLPYAVIVTSADFRPEAARETLLSFGHSIAIVEVEAIPRTGGLAKIARNEVRQLDHSKLTLKAS